MPDNITASIRPGDADQHYATLTLAAAQVTAYRALDSDGNPRQRLVIDIDTKRPDHRRAGDLRQRHPDPAHPPEARDPGLTPSGSPSPPHEDEPATPHPV